MKYKILALSVAGKGNKIFRAGDIVNEDDFYPLGVDKLVSKKYMEEITFTSKQLPDESEKIKNRKIKIAVISGIWKRHNVFEMFGKGIKELEKIKDIEIITIIAGSEGESSKNMVQKFGFKYIETPNSPLASKMNKPAAAARRQNVDYVLCLGSDDLISIELMEYYIKKMRQGYDFIGVTDFYFYDTVSKRSAYWGGYRERFRTGFTAGAGRIISAKLMEAWGWKLWDDVHSKNLDHSIQLKLKSTDHSSHTFSLKKNNLIAVDIKSSTNMTPFKLWDNTSYIDSNIIKNKFPFICAE